MYQNNAPGWIQPRWHNYCHLHSTSISLPRCKAVSNKRRAGVVTQLLSEMSASASLPHSHNPRSRISLPGEKILPRQFQFFASSRLRNAAAGSPLRLIKRHGIFLKTIEQWYNDETRNGNKNVPCIDSHTYTCSQEPVSPQKRTLEWDGPSFFRAPLSELGQRVFVCLSLNPVSVGIWLAKFSLWSAVCLSWAEFLIRAVRTQPRVLELTSNWFALIAGRGGVIDAKGFVGHVRGLILKRCGLNFSILIRAKFEMREILHKRTSYFHMTIFVWIDYECSKICWSALNFFKLIFHF